MSVIEKIVLKVGDKEIELSKDEYEELRLHFQRTEYVPYPIYPPPQPTYPIITWGGITVTADTMLPDDMGYMDSSGNRVYFKA